MVNTILKEADLFCPNSVRINFTIYLFTKYFADTSQIRYEKARQNCRFRGLEEVCWLFFKSCFPTHNADLLS
ncbi:hypothetical protein DQM19_14885 [Lactiplantibacillus plantarum]|nr:hypothetical protein DQM19_14885 [Lactiplantibacillus plantarum]